MDSADAADLVAEVSEERAADESANRFRNRAALLIAIMAAVLAIGGLGGGNATDDMIAENIHASDTWAFYQAKNMRQTMYELAVDDLETRLASQGSIRRLGPVWSSGWRAIAPPSPVTKASPIPRRRTIRCAEKG